MEKGEHAWTIDGITNSHAKLSENAVTHVKYYLQMNIAYAINRNYYSQWNVIIVIKTRCPEGLLYNASSLYDYAYPRKPVSGPHVLGRLSHAVNDVLHVVVTGSQRVQADSILLHVSAHLTRLAVRVKTAQPRQQFPHEDVVLPFVVIPSAEEYGVPILIADALGRRVVNEKSIVRGKGRVAANIGEQVLGEDFHTQHLQYRFERTSPARALSSTLILAQDIVRPPTTPKEVPRDGFRVSLEHGGPN